MNRFFDKPGSKENPPRPIVKIDNKWYLCTNVSAGDTVHGKLGFNPGDCCSWTGIAAMVYDDKELLDGLKSMTPLEGGVWKRHPFGESAPDPAHAIDEFSRDHLVAAIMGLSIKSLQTAKENIKLTKFKLSKKFYTGPALWMWLKAVENENKFKGKIFAKLFATMNIPVVFFNLAYNSMIKSILGSKARQVHPNDKTMPVQKFDAKHLQWINDNLRLPAYPANVMGMEIYTIRKLGISKLPLLSFLLRTYAGKYNYGVALLTGKKINKSILKDYICRHGWIWSSWIDNVTDGGSKKCTAEESKYNALDLDILWKLHKELK